MALPNKVPFLRIGLVILVILGLLWISLEGKPRWSSIMALAALLVGIGYLASKLIGGRTVDRFGWIILFAGCGLAVGLLFAPTTLFFMALKTGLHGHGAEFTRGEMQWFLDRVLLWAAVGLLAGAGVGLIFIGTKAERS